MQKSVQAKENRIIFKTYGQFRCGIAHFLNCKLRLIGSYFALMLICVACSNGHFYLRDWWSTETRAFGKVIRRLSLIHWRTDTSMKWLQSLRRLFIQTA